jgi:hypothetical protein
MTTTTDTPAADVVDADAPRVLSVRQPWAFAIAEGFKPIENRGRRTHYRGPVWIHAPKPLEKHVSIVLHSRPAAARLDELGGRTNFWDAIRTVPSRFRQDPTTLALSAVIATARITGCHRASDTCGPACQAWGWLDAWHWEISDARPLTAAVPAKGSLGLWKPTPDLAEAVRAHLPAAPPLAAANGER